MAMPDERDTGTETQILAAAYRVIVRKGKAGTRMQQIADEAGVNKALLHYYFRTKDKIYRAVLRTVVTKLLHSFISGIDFSLPFRDLVESFVRRHIEAIEFNQEIVQFFFAELATNREEALPIFWEVVQQANPSLPGEFSTHFEEAVRNKEIRPMDPFHLFMNIVSLDVFYFVASPLLFRVMEIPPEEQAELTKKRADQVVEFIWESIRPRETV
ncbi:MAG: TetR/AcrR family transcriptional regulator [Alkalispirochaeta sp.]|jgi:AcrR family transcriptional regulator